MNFADNRKQELARLKSLRDRIVEILADEHAEYKAGVITNMVASYNVQLKQFLEQVAEGDDPRLKAYAYDFLRRWYGK